MSDLIRNVENFVNWLMPNRKGKMFLKTTHTLYNIYRAARPGRAPSATGAAAASPGTIRLVAKYGRDLCQVTWIDLLRWQITTCSGKKR